MEDNADLDALQRLLEVDESNLPEMWSAQPGLYTKFARYAARCEAALEEAKLAVKTVYAQKYLAIRSAEPGGERKKSDEAVKQLIFADEGYIQVEMFRIAMLERCGIAKGLQEAATQRQFSLTHLSKRWLGGDMTPFTDVMKSELQALIDRKIKRISPRN